MQFTRIRLSGLYEIDLPILGLRNTTRYILKAADGLGPPEIDNFLYKGVYNGREVHDRQLIIRIGLSPDYKVSETPASLRTEIYGLLSPGPTDKITVRIYNGPNIVAVTRGYVSKLEPVIFSKDPEVQITIDCDGSYLEGSQELSVVPDTLDTFGVDYPGTVTTGLYYELTFNADTQNWIIYTDGPGVGAKMELDYAFLSGDKLMVDTRPGQRSIKRLRGTVTKNLIYTRSSDSIWLALHPGGYNDFWTSATTFTWGKVNYLPLYWGI